MNKATEILDDIIKTCDDVLEELEKERVVYESIYSPTCSKSLKERIAEWKAQIFSYNSDIILHVCDNELGDAAIEIEEANEFIDELLEVIEMQKTLLTKCEEQIIWRTHDEAALCAEIKESLTILGD